MSVVFNQGQSLGRGDLDIYLQNAAGNPSSAYSITYAVYYVDPSDGSEILNGSAAREPVNPAVGEYYAALTVPSSAAPGDYRIRWTFQERSSYPEQTVVQEFGVVGETTTTTPTLYSACVTDLMWKLREMTRDNDPDSYYRFRPPEGEGVVGCYNQVFGYIWKDAELADFLDIALWKWNAFPPETEELRTVGQLCRQKPSWKAALLWGSIVEMAMALTFEWVANEFDYSIGGISLNLEKSSKYQSLKENAESQFDKLTEAKQQTTHYIRGLSQPRFGTGVRSAVGPFVGRGVLSPRSFRVVPWFILGYGVWQEVLHHVSHLPSLWT